MMPLKYEKKSPVGMKHWMALTFIVSDIIPLRTHQQEGIIKEAFHTWTLQWPPLYCGSLASKTPCEMRWCLWNMRRSLLLGGSIERLWLLSRQILLLMHQWCSVLWPTPMRPDGFYSHCIESVHRYERRKEKTREITSHFCQFWVISSKSKSNSTNFLPR